MIKSVVKHSYIKGKAGKVRARAHINYIAHRGGDDRERGGRKFFDQERNDIDAREVKRLMYDHADDRGVTIHKLILSPGVQEVDTRTYTRELMDKLSREKGVELVWRAVIHDNTDHIHAHVVVMGTDKCGHRVRFDRGDHRHIRRNGDEYLSREHKLERYLDHELEQLLRDKHYHRGGDRIFNNLMYGTVDDQDRDRKDKSRDPDRDRREFEMFDDNMHRAHEGSDQSGISFRTGRKQRIREQQGRLSESHAQYTGHMAEQRLQDLAAKYPELEHSISKELELLRELSGDLPRGQPPDRDLDSLLGIDHSLRTNRPIERDSWKTFESDRTARSEQHRENEDRDRHDELDHGGNL